MQRRPSSFSGTRIYFGPAGSRPEELEFELDPGASELRRRGRPVSLRPQAIEVLALLLQAEGRIVSAEALRRALWGERHLQWRGGLHQCVRDLRRALSDDARQPRFVATVARVGYRFTGEKETRVAPRREEPANPGASAPAGHRTRTAFALGFLSALLLPALLFAACAWLAT